MSPLVVRPTLAICDGCGRETEVDNDDYPPQWLEVRGWNPPKGTVGGHRWSANICTLFCLGLYANKVIEERKALELVGQ